MLAGFEPRVLDVRATRLRYAVGGAPGPPVVLVHGFAGAASNFALLAPLLARERRVIVPDLPGHGGSAPLPAAPSLAPSPTASRRSSSTSGWALRRSSATRWAGSSRCGSPSARPELVERVVLAAAAGISTTRRVAEVFLSDGDDAAAGAARRPFPRQDRAQPAPEGTHVRRDEHRRRRGARRRRRARLPRGLAGLHRHRRRGPRPRPRGRPPRARARPLPRARALGGAGPSRCPSTTRSSTRAGCARRCA